MKIILKEKIRSLSSLPIYIRVCDDTPFVIHKDFVYEYLVARPLTPAITRNMVQDGAITFNRSACFIVNQALVHLDNDTIIPDTERNFYFVANQADLDLIYVDITKCNYSSFRIKFDFTHDHLASRFLNATISCCSNDHFKLIPSPNLDVTLVKDLQPYVLIANLSVFFNRSDLQCDLIKIKVYEIETTTGLKVISVSPFVIVDGLKKVLVPRNLGNHLRDYWIEAESMAHKN